MKYAKEVNLMGRVLVIGLDGATFDLITPWVESGELPNMGKLMGEGATGNLKSVVPPMSPPAWNSFMTGNNPGKHGIFDFTERKDKSYETRFINATSRKSPAIWQYLSEAGKRVAVLSVPITYPPEKVNGVMLSGFDAPGVAGAIDKSAAYPPELCEEINSKVGEYPMGANIYASTDPEEIMNASVKAIEKKTAAALYLYKREPWDLFIFVLGETDAASHRLWRFCDPRSPLKNGDDSHRKMDKALLTVYKKADESIGKFLQIVPRDTTVMIMSDHGLGGNSDKAVYLNRWIENEGFLKFNTSKAFITSGLQLAKRYGVRFLPSIVKRMVFRLTGIPNMVETLVRFSTIDWKHTVAYSEETPYFPSIWINLKGREPNGTVEPDDYLPICEKIKNRLYEWQNPYTGQKMVKHVYRKEEIYSGEWVAKSPDLIIEWNLDQGYSYIFRQSMGKRKPSVCLINQKEKKGVKSADHRDYGILMADGPHIKGPLEIKSAEIIDLAPTILYLANLPVPSNMDGRVLKKIFQEEYLKSFPIQYGDETATGIKLTRTHRDYSMEEENTIKERLQGLGYIE